MDSNRREQLRRAIIGLPESGLLWSRANSVCAVLVGELGLDAAALSLFLDSRIREPIVATSDWAWGLTELEYGMGDGPAMAAFTDERAIYVPDLAAVRWHWPGYVTFACAEHLAAQFCWPIVCGDEPVAVLSGYRRTTGPLSIRRQLDSTILVELLADALEDPGTGLPAAVTAVERGELKHYSTVALAISQIAGQHDLSAEDAFALLRAHAFGQGRGVRDLAEGIVHDRLEIDLA
ncbi:ANTAR domain-containing protein [Amycolatopsis sp. 195334CR]|uniref:ANTAR domain-containing protein n=1 Tax=Amycolatopsis sp. 195334CR TaxID=2814588 RepID=UPI001A8F389C|nr:ANTAR domain-containing protein [Amycolatopsis sp. 195334CR]MBN6038515.1 ANTAR domain-containing protein [Amycolatopsis sp. 195334CR]